MKDQYRPLACQAARILSAVLAVGMIYNRRLYLALLAVCVCV